MQPDYDVLIIGSGFGGSVSALRLTEKGYRVGVLEAGQRFSDADFAKIHDIESVQLTGASTITLENNTFIKIASSNFTTDDAATRRRCHRGGSGVGSRGGVGSWGLLARRHHLPTASVQTTPW